MYSIVPISESQLKKLPKDIDLNNKPVRFLANGQACNICTGILCDKNSNIMYHPIYFDRPKTFINKVLEFLQKNNPDVKIKISYH